MILWPTEVKILEVFNASLGCEKEKSEEIDKVELLFEKFDFEDHLKS